MELNKYKLLDKEAVARHSIHYNEIGSMHLRAKILDTVLDELIEQVKNNVDLGNVSGMLPDLKECNQAALDHADKKNNPDFFLIKQTFKDGINWALNYVTKNHR